MPFSVNALYQWYRDALRNPKYRWWVILGSLTYLVSPLDLAPDLIPLVGQIDDVVVVTLLVTELSQLLFDSLRAKQEGDGPQQSVEDDSGAQTVDVDAVPMQDQ